MIVVPGTTSFDFIDETPDLAAFYRRDSLVVYSQGSDYEGKSASPSSEIESYPPSTNVSTTFPLLSTNGSTIFSSESSGSLRDIYGDVLSPESTQLGISQAAMWCHPSSTAKFSQQSQATATSPGKPFSFYYQWQIISKAFVVLRKQRFLQIATPHKFALPPFA